MKFDLVSDLHIDIWDPELNTTWVNNSQNDILVIAGDTSDNLDLTADYINYLCAEYKQVIVLDGNHDNQPQDQKPWQCDLNLDLDASTIAWNKTVAKTKAHNLSLEPIIIGDVAFVGQNGWWTYDFGEPKIDRQISIDHYAKKAAKWGWEYNWQHIREHAIAQADKLTEWVTELQNNPLVKHIVVVTHTLPHYDTIVWKNSANVYGGLYGNRYMYRVKEADTLGKISTWCFGHDHPGNEVIKPGIRYISNPRGRPDDYNKENYSPLEIEIG